MKPIKKLKKIILIPEIKIKVAQDKKIIKFDQYQVDH